MTNKQMNQTLAVLVSFVFLLGMTAAVLVMKAKAELAPSLAERVLVECETVDAESLTADSVAILRSQGWTANPSDGAERLYSPACEVPVTSGSLWNDVEAEGEIEFWGEYDGHEGCEALLGETTIIRCTDGYKTTS